jgi:ribonuclease Z
VAGVGALVLHHISRRYSGRQIQEEAGRVFPQTVVARDFDLFRVVKQREVEQLDVRQRGDSNLPGDSSGESKG